MIAAVVAHTGLSTDAAARGIKLAPWQSRRGFTTTNSRAGSEQQICSLVVDFDLLRNVLYLNWRCSPSKAMKRDHDSKLVNADFPLLWCKHA